MGMYTEFVFASELKKETPQQVIDVLKAMADGDSRNPFLSIPEHEFFKCDRWGCLFTMDSYYFDGTTNTIFEFDKISESYFLTVRSNLKNYDGEIDKFIDWITPHLHKYEGDFLGYSRYEECENPHLIYYKEFN